AAAGISAVAAAAALSGCTKAANKPLSQSEKDMMRQPAGSVPMPPEAAEAMKRGRTAPPPGPPPPGPPAAAPR
ncbi:MAG TPA: hypothetical protein VM490_13975, partial [Armatimonadaceae bacterium]|nr:hypothetical protein [Armatimonadaceae bacterium]